jgi:hypothetical protein
VFDEVVVAQPALHALAAAVLDAVLGQGHPLDEPLVRDRDDVRLVHDQVFHVHVAAVVAHLRLAGVAVLGRHPGEVVADDGVDVGVVGQERLVPADQLAELQVLLQDLLALERGELAEPEVHHRLRLLLGHAVLGHRARAPAAAR